MEANLIISLSEELFKLSKDINYAELCITSSAQIVEDKQVDVKVVTNKAIGDKCPICWKISEKRCSRHS